MGYLPIPVARNGRKPSPRGLSSTSLHSAVQCSSFDSAIAARKTLCLSACRCSNTMSGLPLVRLFSLASSRRLITQVLCRSAICSDHQYACGLRWCLGRFEIVCMPASWCFVVPLQFPVGCAEGLLGNFQSADLLGFLTLCWIGAWSFAVLSAILLTGSGGR